LLLLACFANGMPHAIWRPCKVGIDTQSLSISDFDAVYAADVVHGIHMVKFAPDIVLRTWCSIQL
jgi:hypothetical protein